ASSNFQDRKALAVEQVVCPGLGDPQHLGYKLRVQKQREIVIGLVSGFFQSIPPCFKLPHLRRKNHDGGTAAILTENHKAATLVAL
ncbi:MAG TPA: hypothetical protein H9796_13675, partial [Candidatus Butyricimonas faecavium]|nr:hypothetical protein [Candidatus Butyricimonas faecavium]